MASGTPTLSCANGKGTDPNLSLTFPYNEQATISNRGSVRKETFHSRAFRYAVERQESDISVLKGHSFNRVLGSKHAGNARFEDTVDHLRAILDFPRVDLQTIAQQDVLREYSQGLIRGVSPGFSIPPVRNASRLVPEPDNPGVMIREIDEALLYEVSLVARPAFGKTTVEQRSEPLEHERQHGQHPDSDLEIIRWL